MKKIVGVTPLWDEQLQSVWMLSAYTDALEACGLVPIILPLTGDPETARRALDCCDGLLITEVSGLHAGANAISGDFSLSAKGFRVREGKRAEAVNQITVAGNFYQLLKDVTAVGSDLAFGMPSGSQFGSPTLLISSLSIAGK